MKLIFLLGLADNIVVRVKTFVFGIRNAGLRMERNVLLKGNLDNLVVGDGVVIQAGTVIHVGGQAWCDSKGSVNIGGGSTISPNCVLYGAGSGGIRIGCRFDCGPFVGIYASRTDYASGAGHVFAPVVIGDDVVVFSHAVISPGVTVGDRAVIAAGSVVVRDVPAGSMVAGVPAQVVRARARA
jgi:acetyltransferase-like isoleucine patch superfamily enzyme